MSLLQFLGLPKPKEFIPRQVMSTSAPAAPPGHATAEHAKPASGASKHEEGGSEDEKFRAEAKQTQAAIEAQRKKARDALVQMQKLAPLIEAKLAKAKGDEKKSLAAKQADLQKRTAQAVKDIDQAEADLEAIDSPGTGREALLAIMARHGSHARVSEEIEVSAPGLDPYKKSVNHDRTTTTSSFENGKATVDTVHDKQHVGAGGYTKEHAREMEVTTAGSTTRNSEEKKTNVSLGGKVSVEKRTASEVELADGRKSGVEHVDAREISAKGGSHEKTTKVTNLDGSGTTTTKKNEVERGEGQITAKTGTTVTRTGANGTSVTTDKSAKGGVIAGKDGYGAHGGVDGGKTVTSKGGMQAAINASVHANVTCNVGKPSGDPPRYPVTVTVSFGASVGVTAGAGKKEGSKGSVGVEVNASEERSMTVTHQMTEAQLGGYAKALEAASKKGGKVAGTELELKVISAGVNQSWAAAKQMYEAQKGITKKTTDALTNVGDSFGKKEVSGRGAGANASYGPVGAGLAVTDTRTRETKVTRGEKGVLDVDSSGSDNRKTDASVSLYGVGAAHSHVHETRFGYSIEIDPKNDPDGKLVEWLGNCKNEQDYAIFIGANKGSGKIKVLTHTTGKSDSDTTGISAGKGKATAGISWNSGVDEDTTVDGSGKLIKKHVAGHNGHGGNLGPLADSESDDAVAEIDGDGDASLTLTHTENDNHNKRARGKKKQQIEDKLHGKKEEGKASGGVLTQAAGGGEEPDTATHDVEGLKMTVAELKKIGGACCRSWDWWKEQTRNPKEHQDWYEAGNAIRKAKGAPGAVAEALARFIGGDASDRRQTVQFLIRGGYHQVGGHAFEFPDSLRDIQDDYDTITDDHLDRKMNAFANHNGDPAAAAECKRLVAIADRIAGRIAACSDFDNKGTKAEMLQGVNNARSMLFQGIKGFGGDLKVAQDPKVLAEEGDRLIKLCIQYFADQMTLVMELNSQPTMRVSERVDGRKLCKQLEDLQYRWTSDYMRLEDNYRARKLPPANVPVQRPDPKLLEAYDKKFGRE